ncbi:unnamed protein product [Rotaria sp. Silwood1]|nr:unnamed protein product [Rotaria sp. Silwood1]
MESNAPPNKVIPNIPLNARWALNGKTIVGGHGLGNAINQLESPRGLFVGDDQTVVIADSYNNRIIQWKLGDANPRVVVGTPPASLCTSITTRICGFYNELSRVMTAAIIPGCIIFVFGVGTIRHLKKVRVAVGIATIQNSHSYHRLRKTDRQLIQMLIGQVAMIFISWIPHAVQRINVVITFDDIKSPLRSRQDTLWDQIAWIITTFDCSFSFYVYLFTGGILFRQTVRSIFGCRTSTSRTRMLDATNHVQRSRRT